MVAVNRKEQLGARAARQLGSAQASWGHTMRKLPCLLILAVVAVGWSQTPQPNTGATASHQHYDGKWWSVTDADEHLGFLYGAFDCLTWKAHKKSFSGTLEQLPDKITAFYKSHPESASLSVVEVGRRVAAELPPVKTTDGEVYTNPHGFLDGTWWAQGGEAEDRGFLEGYLWCLRTYVPQSTE